MLWQFITLLFRIKGKFDSQGYVILNFFSRNLDAVSRVWSNLTDLLNLNCGHFEHLCVAEFAVRLKDLLRKNILLLSEIILCCACDVFLILDCFLIYLGAIMMGVSLSGPLPHMVHLMQPRW